MRGKRLDQMIMKLGHWHQTERAAPLAFSNLWHGFSREQ